MEPETFKPFDSGQGPEARARAVARLRNGRCEHRQARRPDAPAAKAAAADVPINGRIVNLEGQPVAGVSVKVNQVLVPKSDDLTPWLDGVKKGEPPWIAHRHIDQDRERARPSDARGDHRSRTAGSGSKASVPIGSSGLELQGGTIAYTTIDVVTRKIDPFPAGGLCQQARPGKANDLWG